MASKNIEINHFNGSSYDILYPKIGTFNLRQGSYIGNGKSGSANPITINIGVNLYYTNPNIFLICGPMGYYLYSTQIAKDISGNINYVIPDNTNGVRVAILNTSYNSSGIYSFYLQNVCTYSGTQVSIGAVEKAICQLNSNGFYYCWLLIYSS